MENISVIKKRTHLSAIVCSVAAIALASPLARNIHDARIIATEFNENWLAKETKQPMG